MTYACGRSTTFSPADRSILFGISLAPSGHPLAVGAIGYECIWYIHTRGTYRDNTCKLWQNERGWRVAISSANNGARRYVNCCTVLYVDTISTCGWYSPFTSRPFRCPGIWPNLVLTTIQVFEDNLVAKSKADNPWHCPTASTYRYGHHFQVDVEATGDISADTIVFVCLKYRPQSYSSTSQRLSDSVAYLDFDGHLLPFFFQAVTLLGILSISPQGFPSLLKSTPSPRSRERDFFFICSL